MPNRGVILPLSVNVYGPYEMADQVGSALSSAAIFLQLPFSLRLQYQYYNPQHYRAGRAMKNLTRLVGMTEKDFRAKDISDEVERVLGSLDTIDSHYDHGKLNHVGILPGAYVSAAPSGLTIELKGYVEEHP